MPPFMTQYHGTLYGVLLWPQWDALRSLLANRSDGGWYVYYVGEPVPATALASAPFVRFLDEIDRLLRRDHQEEYLGIVYVDDIETPSFIKIYDPDNLGASCGSSGRRILPGWTISRSRPVDLEAEFPNPGGRRRWWHRLFGSAGSAPATRATGESA